MENPQDLATARAPDLLPGGKNDQPSGVQKHVAAMGVLWVVCDEIVQDLWNIVSEVR